MKNTKIVYDSTKTIGLPKNWYRCKWHESLCPFEQGDHLNLSEKFPANPDQYLA
jgi:hypothetical protein